MSNSSTMLTTSKRILIFSIAYEPFVGGAEVAVKEITKRIPGLEFDMVTLNLNSKEKDFEKIGNVNVYRLNTSKSLFPISAFRFASRLHRQKRYNMVWSIMANYAGFASLFFKWKFKEVKFILTLQEGATINEMKRRVCYIYPLFRQIFKQADLIQVISRYLKGFASEMNSQVRIEVIPNGVDANLFVNTVVKEKKENDFTLITTSRLSAKNGLADVIKSLPLLPGISFDILGVGELENELKDLSRKLGVEDRVHFLGFVPYEKIPAYLHRADVFIRPSLSEGMGNSFIEAMAAGIPVIATPVGGIPDFLKDRETGLFCRVNDPKSIVDKVMEYINNPELTSQIVKNAREMVAAKYDWNLIAKEMKTRVFDKV